MSVLSPSTCDPLTSVQPVGGVIVASASAKMSATSTSPACVPAGRASASDESEASRWAVDAPISWTGGAPAGSCGATPNSSRFGSALGGGGVGRFVDFAAHVAAGGGDFGFVLVAGLGGGGDGLPAPPVASALLA